MNEQAADVDSKDIVTRPPPPIPLQITYSTPALPPKPFQQNLTQSFKISTLPFETQDLSLHVLQWFLPDIFNLQHLTLASHDTKLKYYSLSSLVPLESYSMKLLLTLY